MRGPGRSDPRHGPEPRRHRAEEPGVPKSDLADGASRACGSCRPSIPTIPTGRAACGLGAMPKQGTSSTFSFGRLLGRPDGGWRRLPRFRAISSVCGAAHFFLFAPIVYATEVLIGISLLTGTAVRLFALPCPSISGSASITPRVEWPWTYFFLMVVMLMFIIQRAGRSLGVDALIAPSVEDGSYLGNSRSRILALIT